MAGGKLDYRGDVKLEDASSQDEAFKINMQGQFEFEWEKRQETQHKTKPTDDGLVVVSGNLKDAENQRMCVQCHSLICRLNRWLTLV